MWARFEGDRSFHLVPGLRAKHYQCGLKVRAHVATADAKPPFAPVCALCEQGGPPKAEIASSEPVVPKRALMAPGSENERKYYLFVMDQIEFEQEAITAELARLKARAGGDDFVSGSIRSWQLKDRRDRRRVLESLLARPYFGRIDFLERGEARAEVVYVGSGSLMEDDHIFVHDWRADVCSLYYRHAVGPTRFACPSGQRSGEVQLHRTFTIARGQFQGYQDLGGEGDGGGTADDILVGLLSQHTTGKMRQIVQSIQAEQDNIIRNRAEIVAVQGPAGSGKTIIALHRAAYLLYQQRISRPAGSVSSRGMLAFSPNRAFSSYIASVLPDLNEGQIRQIILHQFLSHQLSRSNRAAQGRAAFRVESAAEQFETALMLLDGESTKELHSAGHTAKSPSPAERSAL